MITLNPIEQMLALMIGVVPARDECSESDSIEPVMCEGSLLHPPGSVYRFKTMKQIPGYRPRTVETIKSTCLKCGKKWEST